jgi:hypothetical protein
MERTTQPAEAVRSRVIQWFQFTRLYVYRTHKGDFF